MTTDLTCFIVSGIGLQDNTGSQRFNRSIIQKFPNFEKMTVSLSLLIFDRINSQDILPVLYNDDMVYLICYHSLQ